MTKIKLCGLSRPCDIAAANALRPEYIGFVFAPQSKRYVSPQTAAKLRAALHPSIQAVGVFVNTPVETVASLLQQGIIDIAQLHGSEDAGYIARLRALADNPILQAFRISCQEDVEQARQSTADYILLDAGAGAGNPFDWALLAGMDRPYFLAGGLDSDQVGAAIAAWHPYGVDVSSGIETNGLKEETKMAAFVAAVRKEHRTEYDI